MIKITILREDGDRIKSVSSIGHSGYAEEGSDIVCASVSVLLQNAQKTFCEILGIDTIYAVDIKQPSLSITLPNLEGEKLKMADLIMSSTINGLYDLADTFPKYISIKEKRK
ncbi:MAG: ribosomal-processing cysteine protease Prp [Clostridia bacterium]|nr:ribosomal-processing cysteine protease Prp [Clostridia bacterium]